MRNSIELQVLDSYLYVDLYDGQLEAFSKQHPHWSKPNSSLREKELALRISVK